MSEKVISYDLGTGGIKASLFNRDGETLHSVFIPYPTAYPQPGRQEQAPDDWWQAIIHSTRLLSEKTKCDKNDIVALAISGHSLGVVPIGKDGNLLLTSTPIWSDRRATEETEIFFSRTDYKEWYETTGNGFPPECYSIFKIMWYKKHFPERYAATDKVIGTKDYCNYRFTGRLCTDYSYASGSGVFDLETWDYKQEYIQASGIRPDLFPEILDSDAVIGTITPEASLETGLPTHVKVICGGVDNSCMALGSKGIKPSRIYTSLGSSAWIALISEKPVLDFDKKPYVFAHVIKGMFASATCIFSAGSSLQWVRNTLCPDLLSIEEQGGENVYTAMNKLAEASAPGSNGLLFNPSLAGGSSIEPSPDMTGAFTGLRLGNTRADLIRATMEGIALNLRIALDLFRKYHIEFTDMLFVGGGTKSNFWMQLFADIYELEIEKTNIGQEAASLGAAALALKGTDLWNSYDRIDSLHQTQHRFLPDPRHQAIYRQALSNFKALADHIASLNSINKQMNEQ